MLAKRFKTSLQSEGPPVLLTRNIVTGADKAEGVGDPSRLSQVLHRFRPLHGQIWIEELGEVLLRGLLALLLRGELVPYPGELSSIKPEPSAPGALVHHYTAFDAVKVAHHDLRVSGAVDALAQVGMECGIPLHLQELLASRLVYLINAGEFEPVEPDPTASPSTHVHRNTSALIVVLVLEHTGHSMIRSSLASGSRVVSVSLAISVLSGSSFPARLTLYPRQGADV